MFEVVLVILCLSWIPILSIGKATTWIINALKSQNDSSSYIFTYDPSNTGDFSGLHFFNEDDFFRN